MNIMATLTVDADKASTAKVSAFVEAELEKLECPMKELAQINIAVDELFCNIASYAYPEAGGQAVVSVESPATQTVAITVEDWGVPYGGLGIYIVKKTMDAVKYKYEDKKNILTIEKKW